MQTRNLATLGELIFKGKLTEQQALEMTDGRPDMKYHHLVRKDGLLALKILTQHEIDLLIDELRRGGLPEDAPATAETIANLVWTFAQNECPQGDWYTPDLHSAVACAHLLTLMQDAFGYDEVRQREKEIEDFASKLGVATRVKPV